MLLRLRADHAKRDRQAHPGRAHGRSIAAMLRYVRGQVGIIAIPNRLTQYPSARSVGLRAPLIGHFPIPYSVPIVLR